MRTVKRQKFGSLSPVSMPSLYTCEICGYSVDPSGKTTVQLVSAWVRGGGSRSVFSIDEKMYRYRHEVCCQNPINAQTETLF